MEITVILIIWRNGAVSYMQWGLWYVHVKSSILLITLKPQATTSVTIQIIVTKWQTQHCTKTKQNQLGGYWTVRNARHIYLLRNQTVLRLFELSRWIHFIHWCSNPVVSWYQVCSKLMTLKNNRAPLLYYIKHCASFQSHPWIQTGITVRECSILIKFGYLFCVTLKFGGWPWKSIGHLSYYTSIFEHHFKEFKLECRSGNARFGSKSAFFCPRDLEIWLMTFINNRRTLPYHIKHCASFQSHRWIQTGVTVRKRAIEVEIGDFLSRVTLKFDWWLWKTIGHLFYTTSSFVPHLIAICEFKLDLQSGNTQFGTKSALFCAVWPWNLTDDLEKQ